MGKLKGLLKITGEFDGLLFYELNGKIIIRKKSGFEGKAIKSQPNYERTRENASEFGSVVQTGKKMRFALHPFLKKIHSPYLHNHIVKKLHEIMRCDTVSERGKRSAAKGLLTEEGKALLSGFEFNEKLPMSRMVTGRYLFSVAEGQLVFPALKREDIRFPEYATHVALTLAVLWFDAEKQAFQLSMGDRLVLAKAGFDEHQVLAMARMDGEGIPMGLLFGEFLQEANGELLELEGAGLRVVSIG